MMRCDYCTELFSLERPAGEVKITLPLERTLLVITRKICMECVREMMGETLDKLEVCAGCDALVQRDDARETHAGWLCRECVKRAA